MNTVRRAHERGPLISDERSFGARWAAYRLAPWRRQVDGMEVPAFKSWRLNVIKCEWRRGATDLVLTNVVQAELANVSAEFGLPVDFVVCNQRAAAEQQQHGQQAVADHADGCSTRHASARAQVGVRRPAAGQAGVAEFGEKRELQDCRSAPCMTARTRAVMASRGKRARNAACAASRPDQVTLGERRRRGPAVRAVVRTTVRQSGGRRNRSGDGKARQDRHDRGGRGHRRCVRDCTQITVCGLRGVQFMLRAVNDRDELRRDDHYCTQEMKEVPPLHDDVIRKSCRCPNWADGS